MKFACVLLAVVSVVTPASAFTPNVGRSAAAYRASKLRMTAEEREVKDVKVGVIGCGRIGLVHLEAITKAPGVTPVIVSNPTVSKAEKGERGYVVSLAVCIHLDLVLTQPPFSFSLIAAQQYNVKKFTSEAMDVIEDPEVDAVWICSPSQYHAEQIKACAANGKDVFCEKPIATDLAETVEAINSCNEAGVKLMIGLQRRFDSNFMRVRESVENKEVGDTIMVRC